MEGGGTDCARLEEGTNAWQDEGARGDEDQREDGRRSAEVGGAAGRGIAPRAGRGVEDERAWIGARSAHGAYLYPSKMMTMS